MPDTDVTRQLRAMQLEAAVRLLKHGRGEFDPAAVKTMILDHESQAEQLLAAGEAGAAKRLARRAAALNALLLHGPDPAKMVAETEMPEGYRGKILMVAIDGGGFESVACLRSGDDWHREILHNTQAEVADIGFPEALVHPLGGAYAEFDSDGGIVLWGTSDEYGCCDKEEAARMIARAYPGKTVRIEG